MSKRRKNKWIIISSVVAAACILSVTTPFLLSDIRDASFDSRFWGFVGLDKVQGKVKKIYWSWDKEDSRVRWKRIDKTVYKPHPIDIVVLSGYELIVPALNPRW